MDWLAKAIEPRHAADPAHPSIAACYTDRVQPWRISPYLVKSSYAVLKSAGVNASGCLASVPLSVVRRARYPALSEIYRRTEALVRKHYPSVHAAQVAGRAGGANSGAYQFTRLWEINLVMQMLDGGEIVEFGSGGSTAMFRELADHVTTVDESERWLSNTLEALAGSADNVTPVHAERIITDDEWGEPVSHYDFQTQCEPDLVYVDGPSQPTGEELGERRRGAALAIEPNRGTLGNSDVERMWARGMRPKIVMVDIRRPTVRRLARALSNDPDLEATTKLYPRSADWSVLAGRYPEHFLYHTLLVRSDLLKRSG